MPRSTLWAVSLQVLCATYLQVVEWVDLFPWNDIGKGNGQERLDVVLLVAQAMVALWYWKRWLWPMVVGWLAYAGWFYLQIVSWWQPYLLGTREVGPNWYFARTWKFLPQIGNRPTPDADHVVLQLLLVAVIVSGALAITQLWLARYRSERAVQV